MNVSVKGYNLDIKETKHKIELYWRRLIIPAIQMIILNMYYVWIYTILKEKNIISGILIQLFGTENIYISTIHEYF